MWLGDVEMVGLFGLALALSAPFFAFFNFSARDLLVTDINRDNEPCTYFHLRFFTSIICFIVIMGVGFTYTKDVEQWQVILLVALVKVVDSFHDMVEALFQRKERLGEVAKFQIINGVLSVLSILIGMYFFSDLISALFFLILSRGIVLYFISKRARTFLAENLSWRELAQPIRYQQLFLLAKKASPLGARRLLVSLNTNAPRYLLERLQGLGSLGIYTAVSYFMYIGVTLCEALTASALTPLAQTYHASRKRFIFFLRGLLLFALSIGAVGIVISFAYGDQLLSLIYGKDLAHSGKILGIFMVAAAMMYLYGYLNAAITIMRRLRIQGVLAGISLIINVSIGLLLIPETSTEGAAYATLAGSAVFFVGAAVIFLISLREDIRGELTFSGGNQEKKVV